ncbi:hypothetical protein Mapa_007641 [Marchantia paleacea]|nr:hypothetical protein Mapa_007641 [Marchantia paleacea]
MSHTDGITIRSTHNYCSKGPYSSATKPRQINKKDHIPGKPSTHNNSSMQTILVKWLSRSGCCNTRVEYELHHIVQLSLIEIRIKIHRINKNSSVP